MVWLNDSRSDVPAPTLSVATSPAVEEPESPLTTTLVKVQPARAFSSKTRLEPAAGRPLKVNVLLLPVPPARSEERRVGKAGRPWRSKTPWMEKLNVSLPTIEFYTASTRMS